MLAVWNRLRRCLLGAALVLLLTGSARALDVATSASNGWDCALEKRGEMVGMLAFTEGDFLLCGGFALALVGAVCLLWRRQLQCQQRALQKLRDEVQEEARQRTADLAKSVSALNAALESTADGLLVVDLEGRVVSYNRKFLQMWRIPPEKIIPGRNDDELVEIALDQVKDRMAVGEKIRELYGQPDLECCDLVELKDERILERYSIPQRLDGKIVGRVWSFRDVTEQKRIAREMAESRNFLGRIINSIGDPIHVKDRQHRWVLVNDAACNFLGLARRDILGKTEREIFPEAEAEAMWETDERVFETGNENVTERKLADQAGKPSTLISKKNVYVDDKGQAFVVGVVQNITDRVSVETELRWKTAFLEALVASSIDGLLVVNDAGRKVFQNQRLADLWQIPKEVAEDPDDSRQIQFVVKRDKAAEQFVSQVKYLYDHPNDVSHDEIELIDDTILDRHSYPIIGQDGTRYGRIWQFRDVTERKHAEAELAYERDLLRALLDSAPDAIYFKDQQSRFLRCSRSMAGKFHVGKIEDLIGKTDFDFFTKEHARLAFEDEQRIIRTGEPLVAKIEREVRIDGRVTWALTNKMAFRNVKGEIIGTLGISNDITPIKDAEAKLNTAHRRLLEVSRQAGMAEVATSVLHNVGNVLNSINISVSVIADAVRQSRVSNVELLSGLLQEHRADLAGFFATHPKGKQVLDYLPVLAASLLGEQANLVKEVEHMRKNIEHVKEIVMMQQSYAKVSGVTERMKVVDLVEDALRMNSASMIRHDVEVIRDYAPDAPEIIVERHKVLQILINLIRNAKFACDESGRNDKRVTVRIGNREGRVEISVADNGIGILPENMTRIFNHGFTTRKHGHGFGLHSGALAAREMGGALTAHSEGLGTGALFTLELPLEPPERNKLTQSDAEDISVRE